MILTIALLLLSTAAIGEKAKKSKDLKEKKIKDKDKEKLAKYYGKFKNIVDYNNYKNDSNWALINVTLTNGKYARIITPTNKMEAVLNG